MREARLTDGQIAHLIALLDAGARDEASAKTLTELSLRFGPREGAALRRLRHFGLVCSRRADSYGAPSRYGLMEAGAERAAREKAQAAA